MTAESNICNGCDYKGWAQSNPSEALDFLTRLATAGIEPTGSGKEGRGVGSPFRYPMPIVVRLCCLEARICDEQNVDFPSFLTVDESNAAIAKARNDVFRSVGLPEVG